jgi:hypothetical protein
LKVPAACETAETNPQSDLIHQKRHIALHDRKRTDLSGLLNRAVPASPAGEPQFQPVCYGCLGLVGSCASFASSLVGQAPGSAGRPPNMASIEHPADAAN